MSVVSQRATAAERAFEAIKGFNFDPRYGQRRGDADIADFTFGNPHEMPLAGLVSAIGESALPRDKKWFAYKTSEEVPQAFLADALSRELDLRFETPDVAPRAGAFAAISVAFRLLLDAGDGQNAVPQIDDLTIDIESLTCRRDVLSEGLAKAGHAALPPEGTFYLWEKWASGDPEQQWNALADRGGDDAAPRAAASPSLVDAAAGSWPREPVTAVSFRPLSDVRLAQLLAEQQPVTHKRSPRGSRFPRGPYAIDSCAQGTTS